MGKEKALIGVDMVHYALLTKDAVDAATWEAAVAIPGIQEVGLNPNGSVSTLFADNGPAISANSVGEIDISLKLADLTPLERSILLGHARAGGITKYKSTDMSPDLAIGFRTMLSDGSYGYVWALKGKFAETQETYATAADNVNFQVPSLSGKFNILAFNGEYKRTTRADDPDFTADLAANWFTSGPLGVTDAVAPTVAVVPADGSSNALVGDNIVWTFNKAIQASCVVPANFFVISEDGTAVVGELAINAAGTVVTFNPTDNLTSAAAYIAIATTNVKSLAGIALANNSVTNFTVA